MALQLLAHIQGNWDLNRDADEACYEPEADSVSEDLTNLIEEFNPILMKWRSPIKKCWHSYYVLFCINGADSLKQQYKLRADLRFSDCALSPR